MKKFSRNFIVLCLLLLSVSAVYAQQFRPAMPSKFTNSSPERAFNAEGLTGRSFTNPVTFSCYVHVIDSEGGNVLIDPGYYSGDLKEYVASIGGVDTVLLSHNHVDHIIGLNALKKDYPNMKVYIHTLDLDGLYDTNINYSFEKLISEPFVIDFEVSPLEEGMYKFSGLNVKVIHSPGHSPGSVLYYFADKGLLFVGDTVAFGRIPRHELGNSNVPDLYESFMRLRYADFPADTKVFFGHGEYISYGDMLKNFDCFNKPLTMRIKTHDGKSLTISDYYLDGDMLMIAVQDIAQFLGIGYFCNEAAKSAVVYLPDKSCLKVKAGSQEADFDGFVMNMKGSAQFKDGKMYLPGKFIAGICKPFLNWELSVAKEVK